MKHAPLRRRVTVDGVDYWLYPVSRGITTDGGRFLGRREVAERPSDAIRRLTTEREHPTFDFGSVGDPTRPT